MADISILEWGVYGFIAYTSLLMLILSMIRDMPATKAKSAIRLFCAIPGMIAAALLARTGPNITLGTISTNSTTISLNTSEVWTESVSQATSFAISGAPWSLIHWMIFVVLFIFTIYQFMLIMVKPE